MDYMEEALKMAYKSMEINEIPVGAIIVMDDKIIGRGYNDRESKNNVLGHAEIMAIKEAQKNMGTWKLLGAKMFVTLEPCKMCKGAIEQSRIREVFYGSTQTKMVNTKTKYILQENKLGKEVLTKFCRKLR